MILTICIYLIIEIPYFMIEYNNNFIETILQDTIGK